METVARLPDDSVVRLDPQYESKYAHHKFLKLQVAIIASMFPFLAPYMEDTEMNFCIVDVPGLVQFVLATRLVFERYETVDPAIIKRFYSLARNGDLMNYSRFKLYTFGKRQFPDPSFVGMELWELNLDYAAVAELESLLDMAKVEQFTPEPVEQEIITTVSEVETISAPVADVTGSLDAYKPDAQVCHDFCLLCEVMKAGEFADKTLSLIPSRADCKKRILVPPSTIRVLSGSDLDYAAFMVFGSQFRNNPCIGSATHPQRIGVRHARFHLSPRRLKRQRVFREQPTRGFRVDAVHKT